MDFGLYTYIISTLLSCAVLGLLALYSWKHRTAAGATAFMFVTLFGVWGTLMDILCVFSGTAESAARWFDARFVSHAGLPVAWLVFSLRYSGLGGRLTRNRIGLLFILPAVTQVMIWTNGLHGLWLQKNVEFFRAGPFMLADTGARVAGPWFHVHSAYGYLALLAGVGIMFRMTVSHARVNLGQSLAIGIGALVITAGSAVPTYHLIPGLKVNPIMQSLAVSSLFFAWAVFRHRFLDIAPVARDAVVDSLDDCMMVIDTLGRIVDLNPAMRRFIAEGYESARAAPPAAVTGLYAAEVLSPWNDLVRRFQDESDTRNEIIIGTGISARFYDLRISPLRDRRGLSGGRIITLRDITGRVRAEDALKEKTAELENFFSLALDLLCIADTEGYFRRLNRSWETTLGYPLEELEGRRFFDFIHPDDIQATIDAVGDLSGQKDVLNFTNRYRHRDGTYRWIEWRSHPEGKTVYAAARDITDRKRSEEALLASLKEKEVLMKELQHRVKNNLGIVHGLISLEMDSLTDERSRKVFDNTRSRIKSISSIYEKLSQSSGIDTVDLDVYLEDLAASILGSYSTGDGRPKLTLRLAKLRLDIKRAVPLGLILNELLTNAVKYAYPSGEPGEIRVGLEDAGGRITLRVSDDGAGLPEGFDPDTSPSMGLNLVRLLTTQLNGTLVFARGKGAAVSIEFPA